MKNMTLKEISVACGGIYYGDEEQYYREVTGVAIDSRKVETGFLFVPIRGARVDGHIFIPQVIEAGALCSLSEKRLEGADYPYILVDSCELALKMIAEHYRKALNIQVVGITGSVGKTSTKEMIASVLEQKYNVLKTDGNFNNEIGLPLTIFRIREEHQVAVLEMGINHFGEMERLARVARPDICVITNIGICHLENLRNREGVLKAKTELFKFMNPEGTVILNGDDDMLATVQTVHGKSPYFFGLTTERDIYATDIHNLGLKGTSCRIHTPNAQIPATISIPGSHMVYNALAGAAVGYALGLNADEIGRGIAALVPVSGRNHIIETDMLSIIDDCYNANPISMKASLDVLSFGLNRKVAILGDMFELGKDETALHREVGAYAASKKIDLICCIGELSRAAAEGALAAKTHGRVLHFETKADFLKEMDSLIQRDDIILVKASHGMEFPEIVEKLKQFK